MGNDSVRERLGRHVLTDGFHLVLDLRQSRGSWIIDERDGEQYLDLYTFFASAPLGINPPDITGDPAFLSELAEAAANKPTNPDIYTGHYADFVDTFVRVLGDPALPHLFFIEGGALAVENALKCAFDWKSQHNEMHGRSAALGTKVLHLTRAFHGRSGYTLSLTNTDAVKTDRFPTFGWPRIEVPAITFPLDEHLAEVVAAERHALSQAEAAFRAHPDDIACFIAEPIQGEGGDNHMRPEFLLAMQRLCQDNDALFVLDEVQTGVGLTGTPWAYQQLGLSPDVVAFGKKVQLGGIMAGRRVDEVPGNVFAVSGRINSTWGGGLVQHGAQPPDAGGHRAGRAVRPGGLGRVLVPRRAAGGRQPVSRPGFERPGPRADVRVRLAGRRAAGHAGQRAARGGEGAGAAVRPELGPVPPRADHRGG